MTTWTAPATWSSGAVLTAAQLNTEVRDRTDWLKTALDNLTGGTTSDVSGSSWIKIARSTSGDNALAVEVAGDSYYRWYTTAAGTLWWSSGAATFDTNLRRLAAGVTGTDYSFEAAGSVRAYTDLVHLEDGPAGNGYLAFGSAKDTNLYRYDDSVLKTDDVFWSVGGVITKVKAGVPSDADFDTAALQNGMLVLDTSNDRLYVRCGVATWKYVALT